MKLINELVFLDTPERHLKLQFSGKLHTQIDIYNYSISVKRAVIKSIYDRAKSVHPEKNAIKKKYC